MTDACLMSFFLFLEKQNGHDKTRQNLEKSEGGTTEKLGGLVELSARCHAGYHTGQSARSNRVCGVENIDHTDRGRKLVH